MKRFAEKNLTENQSTQFHRTKKSLKKLLMSRIAKVERSANMKCSGTRLEVSGSRLVGRGWIGKWEEMGVKGYCYVHRPLQCYSGRFCEHFHTVFQFSIFPPNFGMLSP